MEVNATSRKADSGKERERAGRPSKIEANPRVMELYVNHVRPSFDPALKHSLGENAIRGIFRGAFLLCNLQKTCPTLTALAYRVSSPIGAHIPIIFARFSSIPL